MQESEGTGKNPKNIWWNDVLKAALEKKSLHGRMYWELGMKLYKKGRYMGVFKGEKEKTKECISEEREGK